MTERVHPGPPGMAGGTVGEWLASVDPAPPPALRQRLLAIVASEVGRPVTDVPDVCLAAGERVLESLLVSGDTSRETALDLLAVDSLVTYAFQAAADDPSRIEARAAHAMARISALPDVLRG